MQLVLVCPSFKLYTINHNHSLYGQRKKNYPKEKDMDKGKRIIQKKRTWAKEKELSKRKEQEVREGIFF
jgi:hypothetical protein